MQKTIGRRAEKAAWGDESKSEDLPVNQTYFILRTKEWYVPGRRAGRRAHIPLHAGASAGPDARGLRMYAQLVPASLEAAVRIPAATV